MRRFALWKPVAIALLIICGALAAGIFVPRPLLPFAEAENGPSMRRILVLSNPIHTDIVLPLDDETRTRFAFLEPFGIPVADPAAKWLVFGWGGRSFFIETPTWADLKPGPVLKAFTVDSAVMHVDVAGAIDPGSPQVAAFDLPPERFAKLVTFIDASFEHTAATVTAVGASGYGPYDRFFEAKGYFNALFGCNTWTASALRQAGLRTGLWNPLPQSLILSLRLFN